MPDREPLLTTGELARKLELSKSTIQRYHREGALTPESYTPGGFHRWLEADVREQMRELARAARDRRRLRDDTE
jgi:DNA-binding transcriptional MerR regulator